MKIRGASRSNPITKRRTGSSHSVSGPVEIPELHERYNPAHPLLRELVFVHVDGNDGTSFDILLTRVPGIGEEIAREDRYYKVLRVQHYSVDDDGRAYLGWHAFIETELLPSEDEDIVPRKSNSRNTKQYK